MGVLAVAGMRHEHAAHLGQEGRQTGNGRLGAGHRQGGAAKGGAYHFVEPVVFFRQTAPDFLGKRG